MFIRQLGLKAYIDFPGAIHTRYGHALGAMHTAGRVVDFLVDREKETHPEVSETLKKNRDTLIAAGFFHDIGHGPFSHAVDFVMERISGKTHEDISTEIILKDFKVIENYGISLTGVTQIILKKHQLPFVADIVNGPLDVDKLDYLLRDSYHVGLRYSFDLEQFIGHYKILGDDARPQECELGLENTPEAITTAEIFVVIWKSMYELVYYKTRSRVAEKMLEKAILLDIADDKSLKSQFQSVDKYTTLHDEDLLERLKSGKRTQPLIQGILSGEVYPVILDQELSSAKFKISERFVGTLAEKGGEEASDELTKLLCKELKCDEYDLICDIIEGRVPKPILLQPEKAKDEPPELKEKSEIVKSIKGKNMLKVYTAEENSKTLNKGVIKRELGSILESWT